MQVATGPRTGCLRIALLLGVVSLASGCTSIELALGSRVRLDKVQVTAISASLVPGPALAPGQSGSLVIVATTADGKTLVTAGAGGGKVLLDSYNLAGSVVQLDSKGKVTLPADPRVSEGATPRVSITVNGHPGVSTELVIPVRYDVPFVAAFNGRPGSDGLSGQDGQAGMGGSMGSMDPNNPSAGGNGANGSDGSNGGDGGAGAAGAHVRVWITLRAGTPDLLQVRTASEKSEQLYLVDPQGGRLTVTANGGAGGSGGRGGRGGAGGPGGMGSPGGSPGMSGHDGRNGWDGPGGAAGTIEVSVDPSAQPYLDRFTFTNQSGDGRRGSAPVVVVTPVAQLW